MYIPYTHVIIAPSSMILHNVTKLSQTGSLNMTMSLVYSSSLPRDSQDDCKALLTSVVLLERCQWRVYGNIKRKLHYLTNATSGEHLCSDAAHTSHSHHSHSKRADFLHTKHGDQHKHTRVLMRTDQRTPALPHSLQLSPCVSKPSAGCEKIIEH